MSSRSHTNNDRTSEREEVAARTVEAVSWFDRARIRDRRMQIPLFRSEVQNPTTGTDLASLAEQASKSLYQPTMNARGLHMRTIQEDLAEQAAEGGRGIGQSKHSYEAPAQNLKELDGLRFPGLGNTPLMGRLLSLIRSNPRAARAIATPQHIERGTFSVRVTGTTPAHYNGPYDPKSGRPIYAFQPNSPYWSPAQKSTRDVDLLDVQNPGALSAEEKASIDAFTASLLKGADGAMMSPQQILKLHDLLQAGQQVGLKAGPNGAAWMNRVMGNVGEILSDDAARIGAAGLIQTFFKLGSLVAASLGLAAAVTIWGYGLTQINPHNAKIAPMAQGNNPYAASKISDPAAAFGAQRGLDTPRQAIDAPVPYQPFGAVNQNFGNLPAAPPPGGIGAMPIAPPDPSAPPSPEYNWTRVNSAVGKILTG